MEYISAVNAADKLSKHFNIPMGDLVDIMAELPAADVARVVRCRDCANFRQNAHGVCWCDKYGGAITPEDYCSRAVTDKQPRASISWEAD